jgi:hypothetical protein
MVLLAEAGRTEYKPTRTSGTARCNGHYAKLALIDGARWWYRIGQHEAMNSEIRVRPATGATQPQRFLSSQYHRAVNRERLEQQIADAGSRTRMKQTWLLA